MVNQLPGQDTRRVFISYVREDIQKVWLLAYDLEMSGAGIKVWRDTEELWPGQDWKQKIRDAISKGSFAFLACFSFRSMQKEVTYQNEELLLAVEQMRLRLPGTPWLIPVRFDDCALPYLNLGGGRSLNDIQRVDLFGRARRKNVYRLMQTIDEINRSTTDRDRASMSGDRSDVQRVSQVSREPQTMLQMYEAQHSYGQAAYEALRRSLVRLVASGRMKRFDALKPYEADNLDHESALPQYAVLYFPRHGRVIIGINVGGANSLRKLIALMNDSGVRLALFITEDPSDVMKRNLRRSPSLRIEIVKWADDSDDSNVDEALMMLYGGLELTRLFEGRKAAEQADRDVQAASARAAAAREPATGEVPEK